MSGSSDILTCVKLSINSLARSLVPASNVVRNSFSILDDNIVLYVVAFVRCL